MYKVYYLYRCPCCGTKRTTFLTYMEPKRAYLFYGVSRGTKFDIHLRSADNIFGEPQVAVHSLTMGDHGSLWDAFYLAEKKLELD